MNTLMCKRIGFRERTIFNHQGLTVCNACSDVFDRQPLLRHLLLDLPVRSHLIVVFVLISHPICHSLYPRLVRLIESHLIDSHLIESHLIDSHLIDSHLIEAYVSAD
jgi:hypothetical protein